MILEKIQVQSYASEGKALAKIDGKVYFIQGAVPGDLVDIQVLKKKKNYVEAKAIHIHQYSTERNDPFCKHFGVCGGCSWQNLQYQAQLKYKQEEVSAAFAKLKLSYVFDQEPILASEQVSHYRNKLEFTFSQDRWIVNPQDVLEKKGPALGFHIPGRFDKILPIEECFLQEDLSNQVRNFVYSYAIDKGLTFFNLREQHGLMRNLIIRNSSLGQWMLIFVFAEPQQALMEDLLKALVQAFPSISSLYYVINQKKNDTIFDQELHLFHGTANIEEQIDGIRYLISPKSFFQVNHAQTVQMYQKIVSYADLKSTDIVYDLYCGTGSISLQLAKHCQKVVGVEYVEDAIKDAQLNAQMNDLQNLTFVAGDMAEVLSDDFFSHYGRPDVVILDPPRSGLHPAVSEQILSCGAEKIIYVSCNVHTQIRDIEMLKKNYILIKIQAVDMFPQTKHCENIAVLVRNPSEY